ncbi:MAG: nitroreductase family protein [Methanofastidiosum sp.]
MDFLDIIMSRRSIRKFKKDKVPESHVRKILEAAMNAPTRKNERPWHFVLIDDREILDEIPSFHPNSKMLYEAPMAILVAGDLNVTKDIFITIDCSAATENILLAAHSLGLGACWLGIYPDEERVSGIKEILDLPENILPVSLISIGYPNEGKPQLHRFEENRIHYNKW